MAPPVAGWRAAAARAAAFGELACPWTPCAAAAGDAAADDDPREAARDNVSLLLDTDCGALLARLLLAEVGDGAVVRGLYVGVADDVGVAVLGALDLALLVDAAGLDCWLGDVLLGLVGE